MAITIIAKNQTVDDIPIHDMGNIVVPGSGQLNLTDVFRVGMIRSSESLRDLINSDDIIINDGTSDLTKDDSLVVIQFTEPLQMLFGRKYQLEASNGESSTTSADWQEKVSLSNTFPEGRYRIGWCAELKIDGGAGKNTLVQVQVDDSGFVNEVEENRAEYKTHSGFRKITFTNATHTVDIDYKQAGGGTAYIRRARIEIWRID